MWTLGEATLTENFTHMPQQLPRACREGEEQGKNLTRTKENMKRKKFVFFPESPQPPLVTPTCSSFSDVKIQNLKDSQKMLHVGRGGRYINSLKTVQSSKHLFFWSPLIDQKSTSRLMAKQFRHGQNFSFDVFPKKQCLNKLSQSNSPRPLSQGWPPCPKWWSTCGSTVGDLDGWSCGR